MSTKVLPALLTRRGLGLLLSAVVVTIAGCNDDQVTTVHRTRTPSATSTVATADPTESPAASPTESATATQAATAPATATPSPTLSETATPVATETATPRPTSSATASPTSTATIDPDQTRLILEDLPAALLSVSGLDDENVYAVGADPGDGFGPLVMHWNGRYWRRLHSGIQGDLWWISDEPVDGAFVLAGENGAILHLEPGTGRFERFDTPDDRTIFGAWAAPDGHSWAVGGAASEAGTGFVWVRDPVDEIQTGPGTLSGFDGGGAHLGGVGWVVDEEAPRAVGGQLASLYKIWGVDPSSVWVAGAAGLVLRFDGIRWNRVETGTDRALYSIHGHGDDVVAVGGASEGLILELAEGSFVDRSPSDTPPLNGIGVAPDGSAVAVGWGGAVAVRSAGVWENQGSVLPTGLDYHAVWIDPAGGAWMVGGNLSEALDRGVLAYRGARDITAQVAEDTACPPSEARGARTISYLEDVVPILQRSGCVAQTCHAGPLLSSGFDLSSWETSFGPGDQAGRFDFCDIVPGSPERSYLFEKISPVPRFGSRMPALLPPMSDEDIETIRVWIREGAQNDATPNLTIPPTATPTPTGPPPMEDCDDPGIICTVAGTGMSVFDGDGRDALDTSFYYPLDVVFQPSDQLAIIDDWNNLRGRRIETDGTVQTIIGTGLEANPENGDLATETSLHHASELAFDAEGRMLVAGNHVPFVFRVGLDQRVEVVAGNGEFSSTGDGGPALQASWITPFGVLADGAGGFWVTDSDAHTIRHVDADGIVRATAGDGSRGYTGDGAAAIDAQLDGPTRMIVDRDGNLLFCDTGNDAIRRIRADGTIETFAGTGSPGYTGDGGPAVEARLSGPYDLVMASDGTIFVADSGNDVIRAIASDGTISTVAGTGSRGFSGDRGPASRAQFRQPSGLAIAADGSLWVADTLNHRVRRIAAVATPAP